MKPSKGENIFNIVNLAFLTLLAFTCLYPFLYVLTISLSSAATASRGGFHLFPTEFSWASYEMVLSNPSIITGFINTLLRTIMGTVLTVLATCIAAYPLARSEMPHRSMLTFIILFTMLFSGGLIPNYILIQKLGLINSIWSLILPTLITPFNVIIMKNFFKSVPESLAESAKIDGAGDLSILFKIYIPLSMPVIATVALWTAVYHWNAWFDALLYITDENQQVLQVLLQRIVVENSTQMMEMGVSSADVSAFTPETIKAATIIVTILPILLVYPGLQRFFVNGVSLGGVKE
jgi:putative aldouronate transport system permease protein